MCAGPVIKHTEPWQDKQAVTHTNPTFEGLLSHEFRISAEIEPQCADSTCSSCSMCAQRQRCVHIQMETCSSHLAALCLLQYQRTASDSLYVPPGCGYMLALPCFGRRELRSDCDSQHSCVRPERIKQHHQSNPKALFSIVSVLEGSSILKCSQQSSFSLHTSRDLMHRAWHA